MLHSGKQSILSLCPEKGDEAKEQGTNQIGGRHFKAAQHSGFVMVTAYCSALMYSGKPHVELKSVKNMDFGEECGRFTVLDK